MMSKDDAKAFPPGARRCAACVGWVLAVCAAYVLAYGCAVLRHAAAAAERFPLLKRVLECLHLGA